MRSRQLKPSAVQNVCIFCTARLQHAPSYNAALPPRRSFRTGNTSKKPPEATVASQEAFASDFAPAQPEVHHDQGKAPKSGWGRWTPPPDTGNVEQQSRVDDNAPRAPLYRMQSTQQPQRSAQPRPKSSHLQSTAREHTLKQHAEHARARQAGGQFWQCQCGLKNLRSETECLRCHSAVPGTNSVLKRTNSDDPSIAQGWKHVRRVGVPNISRLEHRVETPRSREPDSDRSQDYARVRRYEASRESRFVGLESFRRPKFGEFREEPMKQAAALQPRRDPPCKTESHFQRPTERSLPTPRYPAAIARERGNSQEIAEERPQQSDSSNGWKKFTPTLPNPSAEKPGTLQRWTAQDKKADPEIFNPSQEQVDNEPPRPDMSANERRTENRMTRRLQEIEEEQGRQASRSRQAAPRFDQRRQTRRSMMQDRKFTEKQTDNDDYDDLDDDGRRKRQDRKNQKKKQQATQKAQGPPTPIYLPEFITVANLAGVLRVRTEDFTSKMAELGFEEVNNDHILDAETAGLIASEFNFEPIVDQPQVQDLVAQPSAEDKSLLPQRPPVVTIMGHVDHGKTTLLDWLRKSSVAATEHGGITQHIGAFSVSMPSGRIITFLDTPGHAAFLDMRQRGANVTDIVILVVAADDSVKPQTIEAIKHAQAAQVPMIVAVNKIDKEDSDIEKVKQDLARYGVEIEDYGGDTQVVCVSGKTGQGMETLEESAIALADILDMRAPADGPAEGWVLEATTKKAGRVATVLVRRGTLRPSDIIVAGTTWARVRTLHNEAGASVLSAGPGTPVEVDGWKDQPAAGDEVLQAATEQHARSVVDIRLEAVERVQLASDTTAVNESRRLEQERREAAEAAAEAGEEPTPTTEPKETFKEVPLLIKADVSGSVEAVLTSVLSLGNSSVRPSILRSGVGAVSEFDVSHAASAKAHVVCFNIGLDQHIRRMAESQGVQIVEQNIIYRLVDAVKGVLEEYLEPIRTKRVLGEAEVAQVFDINVRGRVTVPIAGCRIRNGLVTRNAKVMVGRGGEVVFDGSLSSLKNRKQDATEMRKGTECGLGFDGWKEFQVGDLVQSYDVKVEKRTL